MAYNDLQNTVPPTEYRPRPPLPPPIMYPGPDISKKRPLQPEVQATTPLGRLIQPRPPHAYTGELASSHAYNTLSPATEPAHKKKRGRPTKAESQARAEAAAARGEVYPPPRKSRTSLTSIEPSPGEAPHPGGNPPMPSPLGAGLGSSTPQQTHADPPSESSSGKKKRGKPTPLELEKQPQRGPNETESPMSFGLGTGDQSRSQAYSSFTPISAPPLSAEPRDRDMRMEGVEESQPRTTTPHSFKDTVGI
jgi:hypothetical protein